MKVVKKLKVAFLTVAVAWFFFSMATLIWQFMSPYNRMDDPNNCTKRHYDKRGNLVFLETRKDGKRHGHFKAPYPGGSAEGEYDSGFEVGTWKEWYSNGALRRVSRFSQLQELTNGNGFVTLKSTLIDRQDVDIDGLTVGIVSNGVGVSVTMCCNGYDIASYSTVGFETNVTVFYGGETGNSPRYVKQISVAVQNPSCDYTARIFNCLVDESGRIRDIDEFRSKARWMSGRLVADTEDAPPPPFLLGKTRYPLPSIRDCKPVFDHCISCTNGMLVVSPPLN